MRSTTAPSTPTGVAAGLNPAAGAAPTVNTTAINNTAAAAALPVQVAPVIPVVTAPLPGAGAQAP